MLPFIEFRNDGKTLFISGFANITEKESNFISENGKTFKEIILPKAFDKALKRANDVMLLFNHKEDRVLGSKQNGVRMFENDIGLKIEAEINDETIVSKVKENRSFLNGWSFGFISREQKYQTKDDYQQRLISDLDLIEVSLLGGMTKPAYPSATAIEVRSDGTLERRFTEFEPSTVESVDLSRYENLIKYYNLKGLKI
ncbi:HK97 family phage prohead protease [Methylobacterium sp. UNCCL110]|uniref:HK97 family phage prohead protease n=1 Tax=Methylobacterium sp. UNCCL110 TaxID=1449057 RepID=UPI0009DCDD4A|nr:HK97 family phage prohead protease [Methylobacterium sp. UNCCL110]